MRYEHRPPGVEKHQEFLYVVEKENKRSKDEVKYMKKSSNSSNNYKVEGNVNDKLDKNTVYK